MRKLILTIISIVLMASCFAGCGGDVGMKEVTLRFSADAGWVIHKPTPTMINGVYRYGPSLMLDSDGGLGMYTASPGNVYSEWDWGRYRHSADGGKTWGDEVVAVKPTPGQMDAVSTCDPGVFKMGEYYYAGYTSTYEAGVNNMIFVARSKNAQGPFNEKWTGSGWSFYETRPAMIYDGDPTTFGVGEPSFVVKDDKIFMYYNWWDKFADGTEMSQTRVALATANDENWPATLAEHGVAFVKTEGGEDSSDIKYVEEYDRFIAVNTARRFEDCSFIAIYESSDGLTFKRSTVIKQNIAKYCHNMGISGDEQGHIKKGDPIFIAYAYSTKPNSWANWYTRMHKIKMTAVTVGTKDEQLTAENSLKPESDKETYGGTAIETLHSREPVLYVDVMAQSKLNLNIISNDFREVDVTGSNLLKYEVIDDSVLTVSADGKVQPKKVGTSYVKIVYDNKESAYALVKIAVIDTPFKKASAGGNYEFLENINNGGTYDTAKIKARSSEAWFAVTSESNVASVIKGVAIFPRYQGNNWTESFDLEYLDRGQWKAIPGYKKIKEFVGNSSSVTPIVYCFDTAISGSGIRVVNTGDLTKEFEMSEMFVLTGDMAETTFSTMRETYALDFKSKPRAQIMLEAVWKFGFMQEYYGAQDGITYAVKDTSIATVDENGMATAVKAGTTEVTITLFKQSITCKITVK